jgi:hypothetical protein
MGPPCGLVVGTLTILKGPEFDLNTCPTVLGWTAVKGEHRSWSAHLIHSGQAVTRSCPLTFVISLVGVSLLA